MRYRAQVLCWLESVQETRFHQIELKACKSGDTGELTQSKSARIVCQRLSFDCLRRRKVEECCKLFDKVFSTGESEEEGAQSGRKSGRCRSREFGMLLSSFRSRSSCTGCPHLRRGAVDNTVAALLRRNKNATTNSDKQAGTAKSVCACNPLGLFRV